MNVSFAIYTLSLTCFLLLPGIHSSPVSPSTPDARREPVTYSPLARPSYYGAYDADLGRTNQPFYPYDNGYGQAYQYWNYACQPYYPPQPQPVLPMQPPPPPPTPPPPATPAWRKEIREAMASQKREREEELELQARRHQDALTEALALFTKKLELAQPRAAAPDALGAPPGHVDPRVLSMQGAIITPSQAPQPRSGSTFTTSGVADLAPSQPGPGITYLAQGTPPTPQPRHVDTVAAGVQISLQSSSNTTISGVNAPSLPGPGSTHLVQGTQLPPQPWLVDTVATGVLPALQPRPDTLASGVPHTHTATHGTACAHACAYSTHI